LGRELKELREKSVDELREELNEARTELRNVRMKIAMGQREVGTATIRNIRRRVARILTIIREKELEK
jgi:large subunit ribosomal protein L29